MHSKKLLLWSGGFLVLVLVVALATNMPSQNIVGQENVIPSSVIVGEEGLVSDELEYKEEGTVNDLMEDELNALEMELEALDEEVVVDEGDIDYVLK